eukprot:scaffold2808_cov255-Pinguiococcus_pyrenoidosus.AAC.48
MCKVARISIASLPESSCLPRGSRLGGAHLRRRLPVTTQALASDPSPVPIAQVCSTCQLCCTLDHLPEAARKLGKEDAAAQAPTIHDIS